MIAARRERKWKQAELAAKVQQHSGLTASQPLISQIESGEIGSSKLIRPICEILSIPEPMHFTDELMKRWWLAGHLMRHGAMPLFESQLELAEKIAKQFAANEDTAGDDPDERK